MCMCIATHKLIFPSHNKDTHRRNNNEQMVTKATEKTKANNDENECWQKLSSRRPNVLRVSTQNHVADIWLQVAYTQHGTQLRKTFISYQKDGQKRTPPGSC